MIKAKNRSPQRKRTSYHQRRGSIRRKVLTRDMAASIGFSLLKVLKDTYLQILKPNPTQDAGLHFFGRFQNLEIWILTFTLGNQQALMRKISGRILSQIFPILFMSILNNTISRRSFHLFLLLFFYFCFVLFVFFYLVG